MRVLLRVFPGGLNKLGWVEWLVLFYVLTVGLFAHVHAALLLIAILGIVRLRGLVQDTASSEKWLLGVFISYFLVALFSALFVSESSDVFHKLEKYLLFLWAVPFYAVIRGRSNLKTAVQYAVPVAAILGLLAAVVSRSILDQSRAMFFTHNYLFFGYVAATLSVFSLILVRESTDAKVRLLLYMGVVSGVMACILSGTRGALVGWFVGMLVLFLSRGIVNARVKLAILLFLVLVPVVISQLPDYRRSLLEAYNSIVYNDEKQYEVTSTGTRLRMWAAAWEMFKENPILGMGLDGYKLGIKEMVERGEVNAELKRYDHPHNIYFTALANMGIVGFVSLLFVFAVPFRYFYRQTRSGAGGVYAVMGLSFVVMCAVFGFTEAIFEIQAIAAFYVFMVAILYSVVSNSQTGNSFRDVRLQH